MAFANFISPCCKVNLEDGGENLTCKQCRRLFPVLGGIVDFSDRDVYWNQINKADMDELLADSKDRGWRKAIEGIFFEKTNKYHLDYAENESRGDFSLYTNISKDTRVLDLGCGWGAVTMSIARKSDNVYGADSTHETLKFLRMRAEQEGIDSLRLARINPLDFQPLPFKDDHFDLVLLNGVLEWIGTYRTDLSPGKIQLNALEEIQRIIRPGGTLYIGIENRWGFGMFLGTKDHSGLPYTSILPRFLADLYTKIRIKNHYRTYTYSSAGYSKLLMKAGFDKTEFFMPLESYRFPDFMIPLDDKKILKFFLRNYSTTWKNSFWRRMVAWLLFLLNLQNVLICNNYSIFAKK